MIRRIFTGWTIGTVAVFAAPLLAAAKPLVIRQGGTYRGEWSSMDADTPVIRIRTTEPVVIEQSTLTGRGKLIEAEAGGANVTVRDVQGRSLNPNVEARCAGRFFSGDEVARVVIEHCRLEGTAGIYIHKTADTAGDAQITIRFNDVLNIDGRHSDGQDGYRVFNRRTRTDNRRTEEGFDLVQFVQLDQVAGLADGEIAWNRVINEPGASRVEDNISLYETNGRRDSPIRVHDNCIIGAYTIDPTRRNATRGGWREDWEYSGGGIMLGDGPGKSLDTASGYLRAENNVVISTGNYGIAVAGGHDISVVGNRVFGSAALGGDRMVMTQNVGIYVWDIAKGKQRQPPTFFDVSGSDNVVGWWNTENAARNDWWVPDASAWTNNIHAASPITGGDEHRERLRWEKSLRTVQEWPGPRVRRPEPNN